MKISPILTELENRLKNEVLFLDGAMGTMIQLYKLTEADFRHGKFENHPKDLKGNNDLLVWTRPDVIKEIHLKYLQAGADIIETNTFNANALSQADYNLQHICYDLNVQAAKVAKAAAAEYMQKNPGRKVYVAGALGPTNRTASISPDVNRPGFRAVSFEELRLAYREQALGLLDGGVDILLPETIFDTLNAKACLFAISEIEEERGVKLPLMISVTITDNSGRTLSGQTVGAFWNSVRHSKPLSVGINCALGAKEMRVHLQDLCRVADAYISCYPNAGLPNPLSPTGYDETPESLGQELKKFAEQGLLNIVGGCCGTTPNHIAAMVDIIKDQNPRPQPKLSIKMRLSGLEECNLTPSGEASLIMVGERTNVTGSPKFSKAIKEERWTVAIEIARQQVDAGANIIDINFDEGMLDGKKLMREFLHLIGSEPDISRVPVMLDSSKWEILEEGLKCVQGKPVVNSISLKEGEETFLKQAKLLQRHGAAVVVMAFDENGQAVSTADKISICSRAYKLLTEKIGFDPADIIFDPNILTVATGMEEHDRYALNFIEALKGIKEKCPHVFTSGGVSNLSFSFRGNQVVREAMHSVFLYHAVKAGLDLGIVNAGLLAVYEDIDSELKNCVEDVILYRNPDAAEKLLELAQKFQVSKKQSTTESSAGKNDLPWRKLSLQERMTYALVQGIDTFIVEDTKEALEIHKVPLKVIEGPLMNAMKKVGELFGAGKMFLPQVVKSARVMKKSVAYLEPMMEEEKRRSTLATQGCVVMATVKGDVHDIGKNIVGVVLACNGYEVIDLGVMVHCNQIIKAINENKADIVGLSGLITPSLEEMAHNLREFQQTGLDIPVLIGGATTSRVHTAVKLDENYKNPVVHVSDASLVVEVCRRLLSQENKKMSWAEEKSRAQEIREAYKLKQKSKEECLPIEQARAMKPVLDFSIENLAQPKQKGVFQLTPSLSELREFIDWSPFFWAWELKGTYPMILDHAKYGDEARKLYQDAKDILDRMEKENWLKPKVLVGILPATAQDETVSVQSLAGEKLGDFTFERQRHSSVINNNLAYCMADFIAPATTESPIQDWLGFFTVTAGPEVEVRAREYEKNHDDYTGILIKAIGDRIAEASAEWAHLQVRKIFGYGETENLSKEDIIKEKYRGIRPAPGYPSCPDHNLKLLLWKILKVEETIGVKLTETLAMTPPSSVCGFYFNHPGAKYFHVGPQPN